MIGHDGMPDCIAAGIKAHRSGSVDQRHPKQCIGRMEHVAMAGLGQLSFEACDIHLQLVDNAARKAIGLVCGGEASAGCLSGDALRACG